MFSCSLTVNCGTVAVLVLPSWLVNVARNGSSMLDNGVTGPKAQLSLGVTFSGTVSGSDQFAATLSQFEIQEVEF